MADCVNAILVNLSFQREKHTATAISAHGYRYPIIVIHWGLQSRVGRVGNGSVALGSDSFADLQYG